MPKHDEKRKVPTSTEVGVLAHLVDKLAMANERARPADGGIHGAFATLTEHRLHALVAANFASLRPIVTRRFRAPGVDELSQTARELRRTLVFRDAILTKGLAGAMSELERHGIQPVILKGRALALTVYSEPWHRPHSDVDLLVHAGDVPRVHEVLQRAGFALPYGVRGRFTSHQFLYSRALPGGVTLNLDVHWKLSNRHRFAHLLRYDELRWRSTERTIDGAVHRLIAPQDALLHAVVHLYAHHHDEFQPAIWLYDIHRLLDALAPGELSETLALASERRAASVAKAGLLRAIAHCDPAPDPAVMAMIGGLEADESESYLSMSRVAEIVEDVRAIPRLAHRLGYLAELVFPPADGLLRRYGYESRRMVPAAWARRAVDFFRGSAE